MQLTLKIIFMRAFLINSKYVSFYQFFTNEIKLLGRFIIKIN